MGHTWSHAALLPALCLCTNVDYNGSVAAQPTSSVVSSLVQRPASVGTGHLSTTHGAIIWAILYSAVGGTVDYSTTSVEGIVTGASSYDTHDVGVSCSCSTNNITYSLIRVQHLLGKPAV